MTPMSQRKSAPESSASADKIRFHNVSKAFVRDGTVTRALECVDLAVKPREFVAVVGPSGCGKSTLLNMVAGLMTPTTGSVVYDGEPVTKVNTKVGYATQRDSLFPWRTVAGNLELPLLIRGTDERERRQRVSDIIDLVGLTGFDNHLPTQLSGGMRKRVVLARTLIYEPETIVLDEPFGALDAQLKIVLQEEFARLVEVGGYTALFVTHDLEEAILLADRVVVLSARPGLIREVMDVPIPRPREAATTKFTPEFGRIYQALWSKLAGEIQQGDAM